MKKLSLVIFALALLAVAAPSAMACALCDGENCSWEPGVAGGTQCWYDFCPPCGCFTTGKCTSLRASADATADLAMEYRIASVEIRQGDTQVARKVVTAPAVVAEKQPLHK